jgi:uncharacterized protein (DUF433 family)
MFDRITVEPGKMDGQPCIRGMRLTVAHVVRLVAADWTLDQILAEFPDLEREDIHQALLYAADSAEVALLPLRDSA